jgi:hypothetical protein
MCFWVWEEGFEEGNEMVEERNFITLENKTRTINLSLLMFYYIFIPFNHK